ncbi:MAG: hypothetical protein RL219_2041 [Actinomycetota bacterium]
MRIGAAVVAGALGLVACTSGGSSERSSDSVASTSSAPSDPDVVNGGGGGSGGPLTVDQAIAMLDFVDKSEVNDPSAPQLDDYRDDPAVLAVALQRLAAGSERWVDVYVWANGGYNAEPLRRFADHTDPELRYLASVGMISMGDATGFPPLIDALTDNTLVGDYETPIWQLAVTALARFAPAVAYGPPYDASMTQRENAQAKWRDWAASIGTASFDVESGQWGAQ